MYQQQERALVRRSTDGAMLALRAEKESAERANHDKSHFLAVASHDLRQPIHALGLYIDELRRKVSGEEQIQLVEKVAQSAHSISLLINALLDISKLDAGIIVPQRQHCDIAGLLNKIAADFAQDALEKNIRLRVLPCKGCVISDAVLLERILVNLLSNAVRYTPPNGVVVITCRKRGNLLHIEVRDNGVGIDPVYQTRIFQEFFQLNRPRLSEHKGLGLGLAIVDRLVKLLDHRIALSSAQDKGAKFTLELPFVPESVAHFAKEALTSFDLPAANSPLAGKKILVVDGDSLVREGTVLLLASWGYEVSAAASLQAVQQLLSSGESWDMVISDYHLDQATTGLDVIAAVRQYANASIPCILISGDTRLALDNASVERTPLLHKPVKPAKLRSLMQYLLEEPIQ